MALSMAEARLIGVGIDALLKVIEGHTVGGNVATQADVEDAKARLDKAKAALDAEIAEKTI